MARIDPPLPRLGPYCAFTGRMVRPWPTRVALSILHALVVLWLPLGALFGLGAELGEGPAIGVGLGLALVYLISLISPRARFLAHLLALAGALSVCFFAWRTQHPLALTEGQLPGWMREVSAAFAEADDFLLQALRLPTLALVSLLLALALLFPVLGTASLAWRRRRLKQRIWFARFHPVWARRYGEHEGPHALVGVLAVQNDPLLREKLLWLKLERRTNGFRFGAKSLAGPLDAARIPLALLDQEVRLFVEGGRWYQQGEFKGPGGPARLRLLAHRLNPASPAADPDFKPTQASSLPVRDLFAADNQVYGKTYSEEQDTELLGLLIDSRPNPAGPDSALPRFTLFVRRLGQISAEYPHPDLLGQAFYDVEEGRLHLPWRQAKQEVQDLSLPIGRDALRAIATDSEQYLLLWVSFARAAEPLDARP